MRRTFTAFALALLVACGGDSSTNPTTSIVGTYNLQSVNGSSLPFIVQASGPKIELLSDRLVVNAGGTFTEAGSYRVTSGTSVTTESYTDAGTWTVSGTAANFRFDSDGSTGTATIGNGTLTVAGGGYSQVYVKQ